MILFTQFQESLYKNKYKSKKVILNKSYLYNFY